MIHTVDNQNVVFMKQHVEFWHLIYMLQVQATVVITKSTQQLCLCFANYHSGLIICWETWLTFHPKIVNMQNNA